MKARMASIAGTGVLAFLLGFWLGGRGGAVDKEARVVDKEIVGENGSLSSKAPVSRLLQGIWAGRQNGGAVSMEIDDGFLTIRSQGHWSSLDGFRVHLDDRKVFFDRDDRYELVFVLGKEGGIKDNEVLLMRLPGGSFETVKEIVLTRE